MKDFKPLLGYTVDDINKLTFPVWASPKLDGIRAVNLGTGQLLSRNLKPIPNKHIQKLFGGMEYAGFDGELIVGEPTATDCYNVTSSGVMSVEGEPEVRYFVFDDVTEPTAAYTQRKSYILRKLQTRSLRVVHLDSIMIIDAPTLLVYEEDCLAKGYEGIMVRQNVPYKMGRSTAKVGELGKVKRFVDGEALVVGFEELMKNTNEKTLDNLGHSTRSSHNEGMVGQGTLGALIVQDLVTGVQFKIGSGFNQKQRQEIWDKRDLAEKLLAKYKHFPIGAVDKPRFPIFLAFRDKIDV